MTALTESLPRLVNECPAWKNLEKHYQKLRDVHLRQFFAADPARGERMTATAAGVFLDYSKNRITDDTVDLLVALAEECRLSEKSAAMFRGERINLTENRRSCIQRFGRRDRRW